MIRIMAFWAQGYRSLRDIQVETNRPFNVFYGPNGSGKSNILAAMDALFALASHWAREANEVLALTSPVYVDQTPFLTPDDRCALAYTERTLLGATIATTGSEPLLVVSKTGLRCLTLEVTYEWESRALRLSQLRGNDGDEVIDVLVFEKSTALSVDDSDQLYDEVRALLRERLSSRIYTFVHADSASQPEAHNGVTDPLQLLRCGRLNEALFRASTDPSPTVRKRFKTMRRLLEGDPLNRPSFDIVRDPRSNQLDLREPFGEPSGPLVGEVELSLRRSGLGMARIYSIMAQILLPGTRATGIEEPEAHLHAPTTGRHLRTLFERVISEGHLDQFFIATHSNLFDLDPLGYHDVSCDSDKGTQVTWSPLSYIDEHLYEPGPAKRALMEFLGYVGDEETGWEGPEGTVIMTEEMIERLKNDDELAKTFLREVHAVALRMAMIGRDNPPSEDE